MHAALENLSSLVNFSLVKGDSGQIKVFLNGQTPLVVGSHEFAISADFSSPQTVIRDSQGNDITAQVTSGKLAALLREKNSILPGYTNSLNELAQTFADQVNQQLSQGVDQNGLAPALNLFTYNQPSDATSTIAVTPSPPARSRQLRRRRRAATQTRSRSRSSPPLHWSAASHSRSPTAS
jgi:flagellar hook-associated protein 1 FlgK